MSSRRQGKPSGERKRSEDKLSFASGFAQNRNVGRVIAQIDELAQADEPDCWLMKWTRQDRHWGYFDLTWTATRLWMCKEPSLHLLAVGPEGRVCILTSDGHTEETIDDSDEGPPNSGHIRDLRGIGKGLYVCGMRRQVYRREGPNQWSRRDAGVRVPQGKMSIAGFNAIDGLDETDIYAVGFSGEIWRSVDGKWHQIESPTNAILYRVRVVKKGLSFAGGQRGVLLQGKGDQWQEIRHDVTHDDLWGMEWYREHLYVASANALYRLDDGDTLNKVDMAGISTCGHLHANDGVMWSFGTKHVAWTEDGETWNDVTP